MIRFVAVEGRSEGRKTFSEVTSGDCAAILCLVVELYFRHCLPKLPTKVRKINESGKTIDDLAHGCHCSGSLATMSPYHCLLVFTPLVSNHEHGHSTQWIGLVFFRSRV